MIDWDKPIEAVDGRPAKVISRDYRTKVQGVCVLVQIEEADYSNVPSYTLEGDPAFTGPKLRNVRVKREGWVLMRPSSASMDGRYLADACVYDSEAEANSVKAKWYGADPGVKTVYLTWEE